MILVWLIFSGPGRYSIDGLICSVGLSAKVFDCSLLPVLPATIVHRYLVGKSAIR